jgi:hypothetical protein
MAYSYLRSTKLGRALRKARPYLIILAVLGVFVFVSLQEDSFFREYEGAVAAFSLILAVVFAFDAKMDSRRVSESLSTRYVGQFPQNLRNLTRLVREAHTSFFAYADCLDYGSFFEPQEFESFLTAVETQRNAGVEFTFLILGMPQEISGASSSNLRDVLHRYVPAYCEALRNNSDFMSKLESTHKHVLNGSQEGTVKMPQDVSLEDIHQFLERAPSQGRNINRNVLSALLQCFHQWTRERLEHADVKVVPRPREESPNLFFWLADGEKAMFELLRPTNNALGFITSDANLVDSLSDIWRKSRA